MGNAPTRILLVEDNPADQRLIREMLKRAETGRFELSHVTRLEEALECIGEASFDIVLLDLGLPDSSGIDSFTEVHARAPHVLSLLDPAR